MQASSSSSRESNRAEWRGAWLWVYVKDVVYCFAGDNIVALALNVATAQPPPISKQLIRSTRLLWCCVTQARPPDCPIVIQNM